MCCRVTWNTNSLLSGHGIKPHSQSLQTFQLCVVIVLVKGNRYLTLLLICPSWPTISVTTGLQVPYKWHPLCVLALGEGWWWFSNWQEWSHSGDSTQEHQKLLSWLGQHLGQAIEGPSWLYWGLQTYSKSGQHRSLECIKHWQLIEYKYSSPLNSGALSQSKPYLKLLLSTTDITEVLDELSPRVLASDK
jgi:hypothetical protein